MGEALKRARTSLPKSPNKKRCVVSTLAKSVGLTVVQPSSKTHCSSLSDATKKVVREFYINDDISWQAPGRKDCLIIKETVLSGERIKRTEQIWYMLKSLRETYSKFKEAYPSTKVGCSKFCEFRPDFVKLFDQIPHQVCVCSYHENLRLLLATLKEHTSLSPEFSGLIHCPSHLHF